MINWCAICQKFLGETPPLADRRISHGLCLICAKTGLTLSDAQYDRTKYLQDLNLRFWSASKNENHEEIIKLAEEGIAEKIRPIDILFGIAGPLLYKVGELWAKNEITYHDEQRFTRSCETLVDLIAHRIKPDKDQTSEAGSSDVLLSNVPGNIHTLGLQFVSIGLASLGITTKIVNPTMKPDALINVALIEGIHVIGLSIALASQSTELEKIIQAFKSERMFKGKIIVGGVAISHHLLPAPKIPNVYHLPGPRFDEPEKKLWIIE